MVADRRYGADVADGLAGVDALQCREARQPSQQSLQLLALVVVFIVLVIVLAQPQLERRAASTLVVEDGAAGATGGPLGLAEDVGQQVTGQVQQIRHDRSSRSDVI